MGDLGSTNDIDYRTKVGSEAWKEKTKAKKLSAWRRLHALMPHEEVKKVANIDMTASQLVSVVKKIEEEQQ